MHLSYILRTSLAKTYAANLNWAPQLQNTGQDPLCLHSEEGTGVELNGHLPAIPYTQYDQI